MSAALPDMDTILRLHNQLTTKWVQIDLGNKTVIDSIILNAADEYGFSDFGFPHRFRIEVSDDPEFNKSVIVADHSSEDFSRPGSIPVQFNSSQLEGRYVRLTATALESSQKR